MKKLFIIFLVLISFSVLNAEELQWTIVECKYPGRIYQDKVGQFYAGRRLDNSLGMLWSGSKVTPVQFSEGAYQVIFGNGQIGWVSFLNLKEARELKISEACDLFAVDILSGTSQWDKVIGNLEKDDLVKLFAVGDEGEFWVQTQSGKMGSVYQNKAYPVTEELIKEYNRHAEHTFFFKDELDDLVLNKHDSILLQEVGQPSALIKNIVQSTYYYPQIEVYYDGLRYKGINFIVKNNIVVSNELVGEGSKSFIDNLPFYLSLKKNRP